MLLPMRIALRQNKNANSNAETWLRAVSDPDSSSFGQFWNEEEVIEAFKPEDTTVDAVKAWLSNNGIEHLTHSDNKQWLAFDLPARQAEALLRTRYYERVVSNGGIEVSCDSYMLPSELQGHVDFVKPYVQQKISWNRCYNWALSLCSSADSVIVE
jgi:tripeptidyl-peptidase-1